MNVLGNSRLDSSLTFLGMYQAYSLANFLNKNYKNDFISNDIILCASFLSRTQLTLLTIIESIYKEGVLPTKIKADYNLLTNIAKNRFLKSGFNIEDFKGYPPLIGENLNDEFDDFQHFLQNKGLNTHSGGKEKYKKTLKKYKRKKSKKPRKNIKK